MKKVISIITLIIMSFCLCSCEKETPPIYADEINNGNYAIEVRSSSSMFKIIDCKLTVADGKMTAVMTLSGTGYEKLFIGSGEEANNAPDSDFSYFTETADGKYCYEIPVEALDKEFSCAAFSIRKQQWYDRTLVFQSETLPDGALKPDSVPVIIIIIIISAAVIVISAATVIITKLVRRKEK